MNDLVGLQVVWRFLIQCLDEGSAWDERVKACCGCGPGDDPLRNHRE